MEGRAQVSTMLTQVLVSYTIEADYEFESRMPHRTALSRAAGEKPRGPWLISLAMWSNFLAYVPEEGIAVFDLERRAGIRRADTAGMERWGYVTLDGGIVRLTRAGAGAVRVWSPIENRIESRWRDRFGEARIVTLREAIEQSVAGTPVVADYLPVVRYGLGTTEALRTDRDPVEASDTLSALLCRALTGIAVEFERALPIAVALADNALRVIGDGTPVREVAGLAGVAKDITDVSLGYLEKRGLVRISGSGTHKVVGVTEEGAFEQRRTAELLDRLDTRFESARGVLEEILANTGAMITGLTPPPDSWRASRAYAAQTQRMLADPSAALPHFPIVTHRGGYPDGS